MRQLALYIILIKCTLCHKKVSNSFFYSIILSFKQSISEKYLKELPIKVQYLILAERSKLAHKSYRDEPVSVPHSFEQKIVITCKGCYAVCFLKEP